MSQSMRPSHWTSSYNDQHRDHSTKYISPNPGEPMHHFPGYIDPSHYQRDPGFSGLRATLAATARADSLARGEPFRGPTAGAGPVGYGSAPPVASRAGGLTHTFYAPPPQPSTQNYSALRQSVGPLSPTRTQGQTQAAGMSPNGTGSGFSPAPEEKVLSPASRTAPAYKDLWSAPILPHGDRSAYGPARPEQYAPQYASHQQQQLSPSSQAPRFGAGTSSSGSFGGAAGSGPAAGGQLIDSAFVAPPANVWRYDTRGVAQTREVDLSVNTDPRNKFHIPGYSGYVRGKIGCYGETFAKTTRNCLDIPLHLPPEIQ